VSDDVRRHRRGGFPRASAGWQTSSFVVEEGVVTPTA
jgi:hypothetical protein